jgi:acyl-CoA synthetase (AMP-forming)/AMP-acid ligase II
MSAGATSPALEPRAERDLSATALADGRSRMSWAEWDEQASCLASALAHDLGIRAGDRVALRLGNRVEWFVITSALTKLGAVAVSVGARLTNDEVRRVIDHSDARVLFLDDPALATAAAAWIGDRSTGLGWLVDVTGGSPQAQALALGALVACDPARSDLAPAALLPTSIHYTSGTTGQPRGVVRTLPEQELAAFGDLLGDLIGTMGLRDDDRHLVCAPLYHAGGSFGAQITQIAGGAVVVMDHFDAGEALAAIERERITTTFMVPTMLNRIASLPAATRERYDISSLRVIMTGAAPFPAALKKSVIEALGEECLYEMYGATELGIVTILEPRDQLRKGGSCGRLLKGVSVRLLGEDGREVTPGEVGEVYVRSPALVAGYLRDERATRASLDEGYFTVGDVGYLDDEGFLHIVDRLKDMVISGGVNVYPAEIEEVLHEHPAVFDAAVIGVPHPDWGEQLKAIVQLRSGVTATKEELIGFCRARVADFKRPRSVDFVDELPRNAAGKVLKRELREPYWAETGRSI